MTFKTVAIVTKQTEGLFAISCESRADVDEMVKTAISAGGTRWTRRTTGS